MENLRCYGNEPYRVAVVHGGPGAPGSVAAIARELSRDFGVLEPLQTKITVEGQVEELRRVLSERGTPPLILIGHSWGAWLSFVVAARYPEIVAELILVDSGPFEDKYVWTLGRTRMSRLTPDEQDEFAWLLKRLDQAGTDGEDAEEVKNELVGRLGELTSKTDDYSPLPETNDEQDLLPVEGGAYQSVWSEAAALRESGQLLGYGKLITCPVLAIHGDYDPHPGEGVRVPLSRVVRDFRFVELERCGHTPWKEEYARDEFFALLRREINADR